VVEEVVIVHLVKASLGQQELHVTLKLLAAHKGLGEPFHDLRLLVCERVGIRRIHGREIFVQKLVFCAIQINGSLFVIDPVEQISAFQAEFRMLSDDLSLRLKLDHRDSLVHFQIYLPLLLGVSIRSL